MLATVPTFAPHDRNAATQIGGTSELVAPVPTGAPASANGAPNLQDIRIDDELAALILPRTEEEFATLEQEILTQGRAEPVRVWQGHNIVVDDPVRFRICLDKKRPFTVKYLEFPDRDAVARYIVDMQLARNLSPLAASYLRGKRYLAECFGHGGSRNKASDQHDHLKTAERLGQELKVGEATIRRDGKLAAAVDSIAHNCGPRVKPAFLSRDSRLRRAQIIRLAQLPVKEQIQAVRVFLDTGKLPPRPAKGKNITITFPPDAKARAAKLLKRFGQQDAGKFWVALGEILKDR